MHYIITHLPRPAQQSEASSRDRRAKARSIDLISWPADWSIDKTSFRAALKRFDSATIQLAELLLPPSVGNTPASTPPRVTMGDRANPPPNPPVDPALIAAIQQIVQTAMAGMRPAAPEGADSSRHGRLRAEDLAYFDPDYESEHNESIVSAGRHIYYRDMFVWIDHIKDLVRTHGEEEVRPMITQAFRGGALIWYSTELSELEKDLLREATMERWYQALTRRFKQKGPEAQEALDNCSYSLQDAKNGRTPRSYVQDIIRHAKATQLPLYNQLLLAYTKMHYKFRIHLTEPVSTTTLSNFLEQLDSKANSFYDIARDELGVSRSSQQQLSRTKGKQVVATSTNAKSSATATRFKLPQQEWRSSSKEWLSKTATGRVRKARTTRS